MGRIYKEKAEPLLAMSQWKELLGTNKKVTSIPPTPAKAGLFTAACEKVKATPRQILQLASPATAASTSDPSLFQRLALRSLVAALKSNLTIADNYNKLSLSSGYTCTVPVEAERAMKQAALN